MLRKFLLILTAVVLLTACAANDRADERSQPVPQTGQETGQEAGQTGAQTSGSCEATRPDMLGPYYEPGAPLRDSVGQGYVLEGAVLQAGDCRPVPGAQVEFWLAGPDGEYGDDYRATVMAGEDGRYRFESHFPPPYSGRPSHIHIRVSAPGYQTLVTQHYPEQGSASAGFDLALLPE